MNTQSRKWVLTLNNYNDDEYATMIQWFDKKKFYYIIGKEVGDSGTNHLQIYIEKKSATRFSTLKKQFPRAHIEKAKGSRDDNYIYCSKDGDFVSNIKCKASRISRLLAKYKNVVWKKWQQDVLDIFENKADDRTINWYWEKTGRVGKSFLAKYIVLKYNAIIADGKKDNVFNQINITLENNIDIKVVLLDVPRYNMEFINYGALEQIKNGMIYSGKYEGGVCLFDNPHLIVFANEMPDVSKMSKDRWNIVEIGA